MVLPEKKLDMFIYVLEQFIPSDWLSHVKLDN